MGSLLLSAASAVSPHDHSTATLLLTLLTILSLVWLSTYIIYQRFFHPLSRYPGPFLASLTDLYQVHQFLSLKQPYTLTDLHTKYNSQFIRYGPDKLSTTAEDAIPLLYQKGGRAFPKTEFYDAYGAASNPNVFGMRDEAQHSVRRRHMSHSFSMASVKDMEPYLEANLRILTSKIAALAREGQVFDLKRVLHFYVIDVLGELAFGQSFDVQSSEDEHKVPPVVEHSLLAAATGAWPAMTVFLKRWLPSLPYPAMQQLFLGRKACADLAALCVGRRMQVLEKARSEGGGWDGVVGDRKDILTSLILSRHPDTGERLSRADLETEAFGFIIAGTHTTSATTSLLFWHLLHGEKGNGEMKNGDGEGGEGGVMGRCVREIDEQLPPLKVEAYDDVRGGDAVQGEKDDVAVPKYAYSVSQVETSLPYLRQCVRENFRITPVFTMPLARRVMNPDGVVIGGEHIPQGVSPLSSPLYFPHSSLVTLSLAHDPSPCFTLQFRYFP